MKLTEEEKQKVEDNIGLVYSFYYKFLKSKEENFLFDKEGMQSELLLTLCQAIKGFNPNRNIKFSTYAYRSFHNAHLRYMEKYIKNKQKFIQCDSINSLAENNYSYKKIVDWKGIKCICEKGRTNLTKKERIILKKYYKRGLTLREIGKELGLSAEGVRLILNKIIKKLKKYIKETKCEIEDFQNIDYS